MEEQTIITEESDDQFSVKSDESCGSNRVKFLCRYGGRILPRPGDGKLRYTGGHTRVVAAIRSICFADLIAKLSNVFGSAVLLKCQLPCEDLDALVSVKSDEDLENILEEYDRVGAREGLSKVRAFLFPLSSNPPSLNPPSPATVHMDDRPPAEPTIVKSLKPQDDPRVAGSIPQQHQIYLRQDLHHFQHYPSQCSPLARSHLTNQISTRVSHIHQQHIVRAYLKNHRSRSPRWTGIPSDLQYSSDLMMKRPPEHNLFRMDQSFCARVVHRNNPQVQVR